MNNIDNLRIGGADVSKASKDKLIAMIAEWIESGSRGNYIIPLNMAKLVLMSKDKKLAACIHNSRINIADGYSIYIASQFIGNPIPERITGFKLMIELLNLANRNNYKVFFLGSKAMVLSKIIEKCRQKYPNLNVVGCHHGYFEYCEIASVINNINKSEPDILFVAMGLPQKEYFIYDYYKKLNASIIIPVGGAFDVLAGNKKCAPEFVQKTCLEWLWRSRYDRTRLLLVLKSFCRFIVIVVKEVFTQRILKE